MTFRALVPAALASVLLLQGTAFPERIEGFDVQGSNAFVARTREALELLRSIPQFALIREHVGAIREADRSGMNVYVDPPTYEVGRPTWTHSALWYAGTIAHDAYHAKLYHAGRSWTGKEAERACLQFQREVLVELKAGKDLLLYLDQHMKNPTYQGDPQSEADYRRRNW